MERCVQRSGAAVSIGAIQAVSRSLSGVAAVRAPARGAERVPPVTPAPAVQASFGSAAAVIHFGSHGVGLRHHALADEPIDASARPSRPSTDPSLGTEPSAEAEPLPGEPELSDAERAQVTDLRSRDREVKNHERAHVAAGGAVAGNIQLEYEVGPDGKRYAVEGSVPIDVSPVRGDPEATLRKMEVVRRAALAPGDPSSADRQVAAHAAQVSQRARAELAARRYAGTRDAALAGPPAESAPGAPDGATAPDAARGRARPLRLSA